MATKSASLNPTNNSNADFRAWGSFISQMFTNAGWVKASDTGQINWTTVTQPAGAWTAAGYEVWKMNDALQATAPIFLKIQYGAASNILYPWMGITIGTGSDGAGNITGIFVPYSQIYTGSHQTSGAPCKGSGSTNRIMIYMFASGTWGMAFSVERTHDAAGNDTNEGVLFFGGYNGMANLFSRFAYHSGTPAPAGQNAWNVSVPPPSGSGALAPDINFFPVRTWTPGESCPSLNLLAAITGDVVDGATYSVTGYDGVSRTYLASTYFNVSTFNQVTKALFRFD